MAEGNCTCMYTGDQMCVCIFLETGLHNYKDIRTKPIRYVILSVNFFWLDDYEKRELFFRKEQILFEKLRREGRTSGQSSKINCDFVM